jgi:geranylgeranylglycerol-phosphate geranylgeranyltransferase
VGGVPEIIATRKHARFSGWAHLEVWRVHECWHPVVVTLAGAVLAGLPVGSARTVWVEVACVCGWIAGMYCGDFIGCRQDAIAKPHRPIPSGRVSLSAAATATAAFSIIGSAILLVLNWRCLVVVGLVMGAYAAYNLLLKSRGLLGDLAEALATTTSVFLVATMAGGSWPPARLLPLALVLLLQCAFNNLALAMTDIEGDRRAGWRTLPVRRGTGTALGVLTALAMAWLVLAVSRPGPALYYALLGVSALLTTATVGTLLRAPAPLPRAVALRAYEYHLIDRTVLPAALLSLAASPKVVLAVVAVGIAGTWLTARRFLYRHELGVILTTLSRPSAKRVEDRR